VLQGTYETFAQVAREHFGGSLRGRLVVSGGLGGMGSAQPVAITRMLRGVTLVADPDAEKVRRRGEAGVVDLVCEDIDEALDAALSARAAGEARSVALIGNAADLLDGLLARDVVPDVVTDLTSAHDPRTGYLPAGVSIEEVEALRRGDPGKLEAMSLATMVRHVKGMLALRERGAVVFDYGNNIRPHAATGGLPEALTIDIFTARYIRPLFCQGIGPFRWICLSGDDADLATVDELCLELFEGTERITDWIALAREHVARQGLPARIAWLGHGERDRLALAVNDAVADGRLRAPVAFTRDHMDSGSMTHPNIITEAMADGSDAVSDWPLLNALLTTASGADLVALHAGGGGYAGYSQSAGMTVVATGDADGAARLAGALHVDTALGVLRHADAGYETARACASEHRLGLGPVGSAS
jgi:urocanate hydratase